MRQDKPKDTDQKLDTIIDLLKFSLAFELHKSNISQPVIAKKLHIATKRVNDMLKGIKKESVRNAK